MAPGRRRPSRSAEPLRVTSLNPVRDAHTIGHDVGTAQTIVDAKSTALQHRYRKLLADSTAAEGDDTRDVRLEELLAHVAWVCESIVEDLGALAHLHDADEQRDRLVRAASADLIALAELSTRGAPPPATWEDAVAQLRAVADGLIREARSAETLAELDLVLERIDHGERIARDALRTLLGYLSA